MSALHASGGAGSSQHTGDGLGLSALDSFSGLHSRHSMPGTLGGSAEMGDFGLSQPDSRQGAFNGGDSLGLFSDGGIEALQQHPLQGQWGASEAPAGDEHGFAEHKSYSPSCSDRSEVSAHDTDDAPFAGEDSHVLPDWGQAGDRSFYGGASAGQGGSPLLPEHLPQSQRLSSHQSSSLYSGHAAGSGLSFPQDSLLASGRTAGSLGAQQAAEHPGVASHEAGVLGLPGNDAGQGSLQWDRPQGLPGAAGVQEPDEAGPRYTGLPPDHMLQPQTEHADNRTAGASLQLPDFSDSGGWYEADHTDDE